MTPVSSTGIPGPPRFDRKLAPFECNVRGKNWNQVLYAESTGKAKSAYLREVHESWPEVPFTAITARRCGQYEPLALRHTAIYRDLPFVQVGTVVKVGGWYGKVVGQNSSANFDVLFVDGPHHGLTLNCHPRHDVTYYDENGNVVAEFQVESSSARSTKAR